MTALLRAREEIVGAFNQGDQSYENKGLEDTGSWVRAERMRVRLDKNSRNKNPRYKSL